MVSPQIENGYTKIANELLDAIVRCKLPGDEGQVFWTIIRKTYGFNKKMDRIALSQFNLATGLLKPHICRALSKLIEKNMITKSGKGNLPSYRLQKDYTKWKSLPKSVILPHLVTPITESGNSALPNPVNYKRHILTKDILTIKKWWNDLAIEFGLPEIKEIRTGTTRDRHLRARLREGFNPSAYSAIIKEQPFLYGENDRNWRMTFDWFIKAENFIKVSESQYKQVRRESISSEALRKKMSRPVKKEREG